LANNIWTLDFTYFYKGKDTQTVILQYEHRRDCFEAIFKMKKEASQKPNQSGEGYLKKYLLTGKKELIKINWTTIKKKQGR
jgi:hypothetical protein